MPARPPRQIWPPRPPNSPDDDGEDNEVIHGDDSAEDKGKCKVDENKRMGEE